MTSMFVCMLNDPAESFCFLYNIYFYSESCFKNIQCHKPREFSNMKYLIEHNSWWNKVPKIGLTAEKFVRRKKMYAEKLKRNP